GAVVEVAVRAALDDQVDVVLKAGGGAGEVLHVGADLSVHGGVGGHHDALLAGLSWDQVLHGEAGAAGVVVGQGDLSGGTGVAVIAGGGGEGGGGALPDHHPGHEDGDGGGGESGDLASAGGGGAHGESCSETARRARGRLVPARREADGGVQRTV